MQVGRQGWTPRQESGPCTQGSKSQETMLCPLQMRFSRQRGALAFSAFHSLGPPFSGVSPGLRVTWVPEWQKPGFPGTMLFGFQFFCCQETRVGDCETNTCLCAPEWCLVGCGLAPSSATPIFSVGRHTRMACSAQLFVKSERTSLFQVSKPWRWDGRKQHRFQTAGVRPFPSLARPVNTKPLTSARLTLNQADGLRREAAAASYLEAGALLGRKQHDLRFRMELAFPERFVFGFPVSEHHPIGFCL